MPDNTLSRSASGGDDLTQLIARLREVGGSMLDAALSYARLGIPVFPCHQGNKKPLVKNGFYAATKDPAQLRAWWGEWPHAMIGVPTGKVSRLLLIDIDPAPGCSPYDLIASLRNHLGETLPAGLMAHTPRGGIHLVYLMPDAPQIGNRANLLGAGKAEGKIDVRGDGGYMIVPPSRRHGPQAVKEGCGGRFYQWDAVEGPGEDFALPAPSQRLIDVMLRKGPRATATRWEGRPAPASDDQASERRYALRALDAEIRKLAAEPSGQRNSALNIASMKLAQLVANGALSETVAKSALEQACHTNGLVDEDGIASVRATIASGFTKGLSEPRNLSHLRAKTASGTRNSDAARTPPTEEGVSHGDDRPVIRIRPGLLHESVDLAEAILVAAGPGPIYQRDRDLVQVSQRPVMRSDGTEEVQDAIAFAEPAFFMRVVAEHARCEQHDSRTKGWVACDVPGKLAEQYYSLPRWKLAPLRQLISAPVIRRDGALLHRKGYDVPTGLYLTQELKGLAVPERPSDADAERANDVLTNLLKDFPWSDPPGRPGQSLAVAIAGLITAVIRAILPTAPAFGITAPSRGTGKSYYVDLAAIIATGTRAACVATGGSLADFEKALFAQLLEGRSVLSLDNMIRPLEGQLLCMVLTQWQVRSRVLGFSKMADAATGAAIFATGNNLAIKGDMARRTLIAKMDAGLEHPENRAFDRDLLTETLARRAELVGAVLTLVRWRIQWKDSGASLEDRVAAALPLAGYDEFCRLVRDPLLAVGHADPVRSIEQGRETDSEEGELEALLLAWHSCFQDKPKSCREVIDAAIAGIYNGANVGGLGDAIRAATQDADGFNAAKLGAYIGQMSGRVCCDMKFVLHGKQRGNRCWKVVAPL
jgi:hypothetical protein